MTEFKFSELNEAIKGLSNREIYTTKNFTDFEKAITFVENFIKVPSGLGIRGKFLAANASSLNLIENVPSYDSSSLNAIQTDMTQQLNSLRTTFSDQITKEVEPLQNLSLQAVKSLIKTYDNIAKDLDYVNNIKSKPIKILTYSDNGTEYRIDKKSLGTFRELLLTDDARKINIDTKIAETNEAIEHLTTIRELLDPNITALSTLLQDAEDNILFNRTATSESIVRDIQTAKENILDLHNQKISAALEYFTSDNGDALLSEHVKEDLLSKLTAASDEANEIKNKLENSTRNIQVLEGSSDIIKSLYSEYQSVNQSGNDKATNKAIQQYIISNPYPDHMKCLIEAGMFRAVDGMSDKSNASFEQKLETGVKAGEAIVSALEALPVSADDESITVRIKAARAQIEHFKTNKVVFDNLIKNSDLKEQITDTTKETIADTAFIEALKAGLNDDDVKNKVIAFIVKVAEESEIVKNRIIKFLTDKQGDLEQKTGEGEEKVEFKNVVTEALRENLLLDEPVMELLNETIAKSYDLNYASYILLKELNNEKALNAKQDSMIMQAGNVSATIDLNSNKIAETFKTKFNLTSGTLAEIRREIKKLSKIQDEIEQKSEVNPNEQHTLNATKEKIKQLAEISDKIKQSIQADKITLDWSGSPTLMRNYTSDFMKRKDAESMLVEPSASAQDTKVKNNTTVTQQPDTNPDTGSVHSKEIAIKLATDEVEVLTRNFESGKKATIIQEKNGTVTDVTDFNKNSLTTKEKREQGIAMAVKAFEKYQDGKPFIITGDKPDQCAAAHAMLMFLMHDEKGNVLDNFKGQIEKIVNYGGVEKPTKERFSRGSGYNSWMKGKLGLELNDTGLNQIRKEIHDKLMVNKTEFNFFGRAKDKTYTLREEEKRLQSAEVGLPGESKKPPSP